MTKFTCAVLLLLLPGWSQITGKVVDAGNQSMAGCEVYLKNAPASTVTDADGAFTLQQPSSLNRNAAARQMFSPGPRGLSIHVGKSADVTVSIYDIKGKLIKMALDRVLAPGDYDLAPAAYLEQENPNGVYVVNAVSETSVCMYTMALAGGSITGIKQIRAENLQALLKQTADGPDDVLIECGGALQKRLPVSSYTQGLGTIRVFGRPNIIFIYADDWGFGDLGIHDHPTATTPNLDNMAAEGTDFTRFTVANPVCSPSRTAIYTGNYPARFGVHAHFADTALNAERNMPNWLTTNTTLLPRLFKEAGYVTGHFGKWHLTNSESFNDCPPVSEYGIDEWGGWNGPGGIKVNQRNIGTTAAAFIQDHQDTSFLLNVWLRQTHTVINPTDSSRAKFAHLDEPQMMYNADLNDGDEIVRQILSRVKSLGLDSQTLVIFSSDNGPEGQADWAPHSVGITGGMVGRKRYLNEGGIRVPFIARWPGIIAPGITDSLSVLTGVDMPPTFCELAGIPLPGNYEPDGVSVKDAFIGRQFDREKPIFWEWRWAGNRDNWAEHAVVVGDYKLLTDAGSDRRELYNMREDRYESNNLIDDFPGKADSLETLVDDWAATLPE